MEKARQQISNLDHKISYLHNGLLFQHSGSTCRDNYNAIIEVCNPNTSLVYIIDIHLSEETHKVVEEAHVNAKGRRVEAIISTSRILTTCIAFVNPDGSLATRATVWLYLSIKSNFNIRDRNYVQFYGEDGCTQNELSCCFFGLSLFLNKTNIPELIFANDWVAQLSTLDEPVLNITPILKDVFGFVWDESEVVAPKMKPDGEIYFHLYFKFQGPKPLYSFVHSDYPLCVFTRVSFSIYLADGQLFERAYAHTHSEDDKAADICFSIKEDTSPMVYSTSNNRIECNEIGTKYLNKFIIVLHDYVTNNFFIPFQEPDDYLNDLYL
jgi:hypothetical protein